VRHGRGLQSWGLVSGYGGTLRIGDANETQEDATRRAEATQGKARRGGARVCVCVCVVFCVRCVALVEGGREEEKEKAPSRGGE
jgi:hypothetical protein